MAGLVACKRTQVGPSLNAEHVVQITTPLSGTLAVQDAGGRARTSLRSSENFTLVFRLYNAGDTAVRVGRLLASGEYLDNVFGYPEFLSLSRIVEGEPVGDILPKPVLSIAVSPESYRIDIPPRTVAEWRLPWRDPHLTRYTLPMYTPATSLGNSIIYTRYNPDPEPGPLAPGLYRSAFALDVGNRRAPFSVIFQIE
ncbi:hypothetical protein GCM10023187_06270 [Nibrella viscosa]|uniref:DUF4082 domain-containing protein n=1 Tax=Nibrella viscosa TaxID=1084524 RepID=A0ABP8JWU8_9BACT